MSVYKIILLAWYAWAALWVVATIGKPRTPTTPGVAAATLCVTAALCTLVVLA